MKQLSHRLARVARANAVIIALFSTVLIGLVASIVTSPTAQAAVRSTPQIQTLVRSASSAGLAGGIRLNDEWKDRLSSAYLVTDAGCAADRSARGLHEFFSGAAGAVKGHDEPRITSLGDGRRIWTLQDTFLDYRGDIGAFTGMDYVNNSALIEDQGCFTLLQGGDRDAPQSFEVGDGNITFDRYFWPGGATVADGKLFMFWIEFHRDSAPMGWLDGIALHPEKTWLATYDVATMKRLDFKPAPNSGVSPVYGYSVADDGEWTYLFGNSDMQNLSREGGYDNGPHSATKMWLARVPRGQLTQQPTYRTLTGWSADPAQAMPISDRFFTENLMLPVLIGSRWYSATKVDGFTGTEITIDVADEPWGPYQTVKTIAATPRGDPAGMVTYHAAVLPWLDQNGDLIIVLSQIPPNMAEGSSVARYRPNYFAVSI